METSDSPHRTDDVQGEGGLLVALFISLAHPVGVADNLSTSMKQSLRSPSHGDPDDVDWASVRWLYRHVRPLVVSTRKIVD